MPISSTLAPAPSALLPGASSIPLVMTQSAPVYSAAAASGHGKGDELRTAMTDVQVLAGHRRAMSMPDADAFDQLRRRGCDILPRTHLRG